MARLKSDFPLNETLLIRIDRRLRNQLERYAKGNNKKLATQAREALQKFVYEQKQKDAKNQMA